jgi:RND family efflux transporter MFP subunit
MPENLPPESVLSRLLFYIGWIAAVTVVVAVLVGLVTAREAWVSEQTALLSQQAKQGREVLVAPVQRAAERRSVTYPGDIHGYYESPIYAKISGYVKSIPVDKGSRVKSGELLATIESPELDHQVNDALASSELAAITDRRNQDLLEGNVIPQQTADETHATMLSTRARYEALRAQQAYERVLAPFDGIVTTRNLDPGALVAMATAQQSAIPIVEMARIKPVRVYVNMPQDDAAFVHDGDPAVVTVSQFPGRKFTGAVTRHPEALMTRTRTMLVEVDLPNDDLALLPGMYAHVEVTLAGGGATALVPDDTLVFNGGKVFVPVVRDNHVHLVEVKLGMDDGIKCEIIEGLTGDEVVALNLGQSAHDGEVVRPLTMPKR